MSQNNPDSPIFVVGAPRSGTSVLTWCLGQHPNIIPMEESCWMGDFAVSAAVAHALGTSRGERSQLAACDVSLDDFLSSLGKSVNALLLGRLDALKANAERAARADPSLAHHAYQLARGPGEPKGRWVDGTPEYSLHIPALRRLFPAARFIHLARDAGSVVRSLLKFREASGIELVRNEADAYRYWLRTVRACVAAEHAWGSGSVLRVRYRDLTENPTLTFARILDFVGEPFSAACLEPLQARINSSAVPPGFDGRDPATDPALREEAESLSAELLQEASVDLPADTAAQAKQAAAFAERTEYFRILDNEYIRSQEVIVQLNRELEERGIWAAQLDREIDAKNARIVELQKEVEDRGAWALQLDRDVGAGIARIVELQKELEERSAWALRLAEERTAKDDRISELFAQLDEARAVATGPRDQT